MGGIIQGLNSYAGLFSMLIVCFSAWFAGKSMSRSKVNEDANNAQQRLITAMHTEIDMLTRRVDDATKENARLQLVMETVSAALKAMGLIVTVEGEMVRIKDDKNNSTTTRIHGTGWAREEDR